MHTQSLCDGDSANSFERNFRANSMTAPQLIDSYMSKVKGAWSIYKFIHFMKVAHQSRFTHKMFDECKMSESKINTEFLKDPEVASNKCLQRVTPRDQRKYKEESVKYLVSNFTFTPRLNENTERIAQESRRKLISERSISSSRNQPEGKSCEPRDNSDL